MAVRTLIHESESTQPNNEAVNDFFVGYDAKKIATPLRPVTTATTKPRRAFGLDLELLCIVFCFAMAAWYAIGSFKPTKTVIASSTAPRIESVQKAVRAQTVAPKRVPKVVPMQISDMRVGMRSIGANPLREQVDATLVDPDSETWRHLVLRMTKRSGRLLHINLLRELLWIESVGAEEGGSFFLNLPEMGAVGDAYVVSIGPCPEIQTGPGNVVTGTFAHEVDPDSRLMRVELDNGDVIDGATDNHPFFSVRRNDYVPIGEMSEGDRVKVQSGIATITKLDVIPIVPGELLYNLEIHREHVYQVGKSGILVHNTCPLIGVTQREAAALGNALRGIEVNGQRAISAVEAFGSRASSTFRGRPPLSGSDLDVFLTLDSRVVNSAAARREVLSQIDEVKDLWLRTKGYPLQIVEELDVLANSVKNSLLNTPFIPLP